MEMAATVTYTVQISNDDFKVKRITRLFSVDRPSKDILTWAGYYIKNVKIDDITFSDYTGHSI